VIALTDEDDWVFDPFAGVGSALIAAVKNNRRAMGSEKESEYVEIARERLISYYNGTLSLRPLGTPVYTPSGREKISKIPDEWKKDNKR
jgi:adenine-specific DNA-methyltransferase